MSIRWTTSLATGSEQIDSQHRTIFDRINAMLDACNKGKGRQEVGNLVAFLEDYVVTHFMTEELYMKRYGYQEYAAHRQQHEEFIRNLADLKQHLNRDGAGVHTVIAANRLVVSWFMEHISKVDTRLGSFLKGRQ